MPNRSCHSCVYEKLRVYKPVWRDVRQTLSAHAWSLWTVRGLYRPLSHTVRHGNVTKMSWCCPKSLYTFSLLYFDLSFVWRQSNWHANIWRGSHYFHSQYFTSHTCLVRNILLSPFWRYVRRQMFCKFHFVFAHMTHWQIISHTYKTFTDDKTITLSLDHTTDSSINKQKRSGYSTVVVVVVIFFEYNQSWTVDNSVNCE